MPPSAPSFSRRGLSSFLGVLVLLAAAFGLSALLYQGFASSFRFVEPPIYSFRFSAADTGLGFLQVEARFDFDRPVRVGSLLLNSSERGFAAMAPDGSYIPSPGGVEFFSVNLPQGGSIQVSNVSFAIIDGIIATSSNVSLGRHAVLLAASGDFRITAPGFQASRASGTEPWPFEVPNDLSQGTKIFVILLPLKEGSTLKVTLLFDGGIANGFISV